MQSNSNTRPGVCEKHGEYTAQWVRVINDWSGCPNCRDESVDEREHVLKKHEDYLVLNMKGVPERYRKATMKNYVTKTDEQRNAVMRLVQYVLDLNNGRKVPNLILHGSKGTGKTHLMFAVVKAVQGAKYTKASELIRRVKVSFSPRARETELDILDELSRVPLLLIDEVGRQGGTVFEGNFIFDLIDNRYNAILPTVIGSNLAPTGELGAVSIETYLGSASMDRLNEDVVSIPFTWENWRGGTAVIA